MTTEQALREALQDLVSRCYPCLGKGTLAADFDFDRGDDDPPTPCSSCADARVALSLPPAPDAVTEAALRLARAVKAEDDATTWPTWPGEQTFSREDRVRLANERGAALTAYRAALADKEPA